ncbi:MAG: type I restriction endonuclease subunit R [Oscillospiraceae bacterium]|nr:type I restriction endonuclease subunit R [Oscillospiraceae bacterium]
MNQNAYLEDVISKNPALELLQQLGYTYLSPADCEAQRDGLYNVVLRDVLRTQLGRLNRYSFGGTEHTFSPENIERAVDEIDEPLAGNLVVSSEKIYNDLMLGRSYPETLADGRTMNFNLRYIDWDDLSNNVFHVTEEFTVHSADRQHDTRPDIVLFVNGIPFAVIECKAPTVSVEQAVEQMIRNQKPDYTPQLFKFTQIVAAASKNFFKYATTGTPKKFWNVWREEDTEWRDGLLEQYITGRSITAQDRDIVSLFAPQRLMELTRYFIVYDANIKKICRHQQFFAIRSIIRTINTDDENGNRQSGVIWHTQGSGKSLTMVMLAKYILMELHRCHPKVIIVTDRKDLDNQIAKTFAHTRLSPAKATTGKHLVELIQSNKADVVTTIINKFNTAENQKVKITDRNIFVLVDESHRSNYGSLATKMRTVFPCGCYIGFTGTPLMKKEKSTVGRFGDYIHKYTIKDAVDDKAIVPLLYEGRFVDQKVDEENIDLWFEKTTRRLNEREREDLKQKWSSIKRLTSTDARIRRIALDIEEHFTDSVKNTGMKAMLATNFKRDAVRYLEVFEQLGTLNCAVVISSPDMREGEDDVLSETDNKVIAFWNKMMQQYGDADTYEETVKNKFCDGEIDILIVCSKLLTGFDAPICQVLYIDKELKEHGLLQAIARTNRLYEGKDFGLIVDYRGLIQKLDTAMNMYSGAGLENFEGSDLSGAIVDVITVVGELREAYSQLCDLFIGVTNKEDANAYEDKLADEDLRKDFYALLCRFGKALAIVVNSEKAYAAVPSEEIKKYKAAFILFSKIRKSVKIRYADAIDNKEYEPIMQNLLDQNLSVTGLKIVTAPVDILDSDGLEEQLKELGTARAKADAIRSRMTKSISEKYDENPAYYDAFSKKIKEALELYRNQVISEAEYLEKMTKIMEEYRSGKTELTYPERIKNNVHAQAFYGVVTAILDEVLSVSDNRNIIADLCADITDSIKEYSKVDWTSNIDIHKKINHALDDLLYDYSDQNGWNLSFEIMDKIIDNVKTIALRRF